MSLQAQSSTPAPRAGISWWPFVVIAAAYALVALQQITLPGVYMDAVNPDYLVVRILNPQAEPITAWLLPGNYLGEKTPVLISFYHGSQQFWLGLPMFWLFGTSVTGIRLTHAMFGLGVLAALYAMLARSGMRPWQAMLACATLAIDPGFSYAFRTQSYITLAPAAWLFLSLYCLQRAATLGTRNGRWLAASGTFYGLAIVGYFIYAFFLPAMLLAVRLWSPPAAGALGVHPRPAPWPTWLTGLALGGMFYPIGYALTIHNLGGFANAWSYFQQTQKALNAFSEQAPLLQRISHEGTLIASVVQNWFHHMLIFDEYAPVPGASYKTALVFGGPVMLWAAAEIRRQASPQLRVLVALGVSFAAIALVFGTRLSGHHFMVLLPLAYAALAEGLRTRAGIAIRRRAASMAFVLTFATLAALNVGGQLREANRLRETRGIGLFSDAINRLATDLNARERKPFVYFPDWGLSMPIALLTGGTVGMDSLDNFTEARRMLCAGRDVAVAVITGDRAARVEEWQQSLRWSAPETTVYRQADGKDLFALATFPGQLGGPDCPP